ATLRHEFTTRKGPGEFFLEIVLPGLLASRDSDSIEGSGYIFLVTPQGDFLARTHDRRVVSRRLGPDLQGTFTAPESRGGPEFRVVPDPLDGRPSWVVVAPLTNAPLSVGAVFPESEVLAELRAVLQESLGLAVLSLALTWLLVALVARSVTRPLQDLSQASQALAEGHFQGEFVPPDSRDEVGDLGQALGKMVGDLKAHVEEIQRVTRDRERLAREMELARQVQASIMPGPFPERPDVSVAARTTSANEVGGDFHDYFVRADGKLCAVLADAAGKGLKAAIYAVLTRTVLKARLLRGASPGQALLEANELLCLDNVDSMFVTVTVAILDPASGRLTAASAGHLPPILKAGSQVRTLDLPANLPVGVQRVDAFQEYLDELAPGDALILYSDGITEAASGSEQFGYERLLELMGSTPAERLLEEVFREVGRFAPGSPGDDRTVLVVRRLAVVSPP
ncbi:MAG: SpoIIE family protein phosphatase, partial [Candidatus Eremiobacterota bacterium]